MNVEGGASQNTYAKNIYGRATEPIRSHSHDETWIWSKKDLAVVFNFLARFGSPPPPTVSPPPPPSASAPLPPLRLHRRLPGRDPPHQRLREFHPNPPQFLPAPTNPPNSRAPPGHSRRKFVPKPRFFFRPFAFAPPAAAPFSFLTPPRSAPFIAAPDRVFSSEGAGFRGRRSRIRLRRRRFGPQVAKGLWIWGDFFSAV